MKIAVIGASGNLGSRVVRQALERGIEVKGFIYKGKTPAGRSEMVRKNLFNIAKDDIADCDVMVSAYGSGFHADPAWNLNAYRKYIELNQETKRHVIVIGGAGSLYTDAERKIFCYETSEHPEFLREISRNIKLGIDEMRKTENINWTVVCPSLSFDIEGGLTGNYTISEKDYVLFNKKGESRVTYDDLASAMLDIAEENLFCCRQVTVLTNEF